MSDITEYTTEQDKIHIKQIEQLGDLLYIFNLLKSTSGKNDKAEIIKGFENNELFTSSMKFLLNPFITTGISKKRLSKDLNGVYHSTKSKIKTLTEALTYIKNHNTGRDEDVLEIQGYLSLLKDNYKFDGDKVTLIEQLLTKELKLGIDSTWNKNVSDENKIPEFGCQLAKKYEDHESKIKGVFTLTKKLDGTRLIIIKENGVSKAHTRSGLEYEGLEDILSEIDLCERDNFILDGELLAEENDSLTSGELYAETVSKAMSKGKNKKGLEFHVFDILPLDEFRNGKSKKNHIARKIELDNFVKSQNFKLVKALKTLFQGDDKSKIVDYADYATEQGWEGLMVNLDKPYVCKRTDSLLKVKKFHTCDVLVTDVIEGDGKNKGMLGAITVRFRHEYEEYECNCGSGFSDEERKFYWDNPEKLIGKIVELGYFEVSKNKDGGYGLRFPTWKGIVRHDKDEISMN